MPNNAVVGLPLAPGGVGEHMSLRVTMDGYNIEGVGALGFQQEVADLKFARVGRSTARLCGQFPE